MISVSNVSANQAGSYYEKDGYYVRPNIQDSLWNGILKDILNLPDNVAREDFNRLVFERDEYAGMDICFSPSKSVSIAALCGDEETRKIIRSAFDEAVDETLKVIEKEEIIARVTTNGKTEKIKTGNMICAQFTHYVSRDNDPQLHKHCVVLNKTLYNGKYYAVDNRSFYQNRGNYIQLFENTLAAKLLATGIDLRDHRSKEGRFEIKDISDEAIKQFSKRRAAIEKQVKAWGTTTEVAGEQAALKTRKAKEHQDLGLLTESWNETLREIGQEPIKILLEPIIPSEQQIQDVYNRALNRMRRKTYAFTEKSLKRTFLAYGVTLGVNEGHFNTLFHEGIGREIHVLGERKFGRKLDTYYCTETSYRMETEIFEGVDKSRNTMEAIRQQDVEDFLNKIATSDQGELLLNIEQWEAAKAIATTHDQHFAVQGLAGTGKTHMLNYASRVLEANGYEVKGACYTGKAASGLQKDAKISSSTLHSFLNGLEREAGHMELEVDFKNKASWNLDGLRPGPKKEVWIVDEASMVDNVAFWHLMKAAELKKAKVVYVGDDRQHAPVGIGNAFGNMVNSGKIGLVTMEKIMRQKDDILRESVIEAVRGDIGKSFSKLKNKIEVIPEKKERMTAIVNDYMRLAPEQRDHTTILTADNADRKKINRQIRKELLKSGSLNEGLKCEVEGENGNTLKREFAVGDKVIFLQNDKKLGVMNGQTGFVEEIKGNTLVVVSDKDPARERIITEVDLNEYRHIDHGYAMTSHKAQGITEDRVLIHIDSSQSMLNNRNAFYVDISRARYDVKLYVDDLQKVKRQVKDFARKLTSDDFSPIPPASQGDHQPDSKGLDDSRHRFDIARFKETYDKQYANLNANTQILSFDVSKLRRPEIGVAQKMGYKGSPSELMKHSVCYLREDNIQSGEVIKHYLTVDCGGGCRVWNDKTFQPSTTEYTIQIKAGTDIYKFYGRFDNRGLASMDQLRALKEYYDSIAAKKELTLSPNKHITKGPSIEM